MNKLIKIGNKLVKFGTKLGAIQILYPHTVEIGGRVYKTVTMPDGREWMAENLDFLPSDSSIQLSPSGTPSTPAAWYYNNDEATYGEEGKKYGLLYNWYAAKALTITGWHLPSATEWDTLATACGGAYSCGTKLKSTTDWSSGNGTDEFGFAIFPTGSHSSSGSFVYLGSAAYFWTSNEDSSTNAYNRIFGVNSAMESMSRDKTSAYAIRLIKDIE